MTANAIDLAPIISQALAGVDDAATRRAALRLAGHILSEISAELGRTAGPESEGAVIAIDAAISVAEFQHSTGDVNGRKH